MNMTFDDTNEEINARMQRTIKHLKRVRLKVELWDALYWALGALVFVVAVAGIIAMAAGLVLYESWVLQTVWAWLVVPNTKLPAIPLALAVGVFLIIGLLRVKSMYRNAVKQEYYVAGVFLAPTVILGFAWLAKTFL